MFKMLTLIMIKYLLIPPSHEVYLVPIVYETNSGSLN